MDKFGRNYRLTIEAPIPGAPPIVIQPPFTVEFDIDRTILSEVNTAHIRIYNLAKSTRRAIYKDRYQTAVYRAVELQAGYGDTLVPVFRGNIAQAGSVREGVDYITTIESLDGGFAYINAQFHDALQKGTANNEVLKAILDSLKDYNVSRGTIGTFDGELGRGNSIVGSSVEQANILAEGGFFIDLEKAHCLGNNECIRGSLVQLTSSAGLLNTPFREEQLLSVEILFEPRLLIGQLINLNSLTEDAFNGDYKVISLHHQGMVSPTVCGSATTKVGLWFGEKQLRVVN